VARIFHPGGTGRPGQAAKCGVGRDLGAVEAAGDLPGLREPQLLGQLQDLDETLAQQRLVLAAKRADRIVIRMGIRGEQSHRDVVVGGLLDPKVPVA
jgi:hypothetical protein